MFDRKPDYVERLQPLTIALSRWENEGGAGPRRQPLTLTFHDRESEVSQFTNVEFSHLRARVIALENLVLTLLSETSDRQLGLAREMAAYISPRPGFTHHPLTIRAAAQMIHLVERAAYFRATTPS